MQLPRTGHTSHSTPADDGPCTDTGVQSDPVPDGLLQRCAPWCSNLHHPEVATCLHMLQRCSDRPPDPRRSHATPLVNTLHWLPVQQRIDYQVAILNFEVYSTSTPSYLHRLYSRTERTSTICDDDRPLRRCADRSPRQQWQSAHSAAQHQPSGTRCQGQFWTVIL